MPASPQQVAEAGLWLQQFTVASQNLKDTTEATAQSAWLSFDGWYDAALVAALATELANTSTAAQQVTAGLASQYLTNVAAVAAATRLPTVAAPRIQTVRAGVPLDLVHRRPAEAYKRAIATGSTHQEALHLAGLRGGGLVRSDLTLQDRAVMAATMESIGVDHFRRVIRPEVSKTGTCGLCIVAADRIYTTGDLMPIHPPSCACVVMPIMDGNDPGTQLNRDDLDLLYAQAGSNTAEDLRTTRYQVNQHGELGPVLTKQGDSFRGPSKVALEDDPERARRMLEKVEPVLADLERRDADGLNVADPLAYQRALVARLRRIVRGTTASAA